MVDEHELLAPEPVKPVCSLTVDDCPNKNFRVNKETCECECDLMCIATMTMDPKTCTCKPIDFGGPSTSVPELPDVPCDSDGNKICPKDQICARGEYYDDRACACMPAMKCKKMCPRGQNLDPRYSCKCEDSSVIRKELYECEPDEEEDPFGFSDLGSVFNQPKPVPVTRPASRRSPQPMSPWGNRPSSYNPYGSNSGYGQR